MTRTRKTLAWAGGIFVLLVAVLVVILATFDWNRIKPTINSKVLRVRVMSRLLEFDLTSQLRRHKCTTGKDAGRFNPGTAFV